MPVCTGLCQPGFTPPVVKLPAKALSALFHTDPRRFYSPRPSAQCIRVSSHIVPDACSPEWSSCNLFQSPLAEPLQNVTAGSSAAASRCSFRSLNRGRLLRQPALFTTLLSDPRFQAPAANRHSRPTSLPGRQRRASATGLTSQNLLAEPHYSSALRPTLLSVSSCEDTEKTSVSLTGALQPPLAGILPRRQLRRPILPADSPFEVSVQSTRHSSQHSQSNPPCEGHLESTCYHRFDHH